MSKGQFTKFSIPFASTGAFDKLILDYIGDAQDLRDFYLFRPTPGDTGKALELYKNPRLDRILLAGTIKAQYESIPPTGAVAKNIALLADEKTFTVTTGHQLNLFSGPLYVLFKLLSAVKLAEDLKKRFPENNFVPVYWMATEDHDIEEINHFSLFGKTFRLENGYSGPAGDMPTHGIESILSEIKNLAGNMPHAGGLSELMKVSYAGSATLTEATRKWVNNLLGRFGIVCVDGSDKNLKPLFSDVIADELFGMTTEKIVNETSERLGQKYNVQVTPRNINLFYTGKSLRSRIVFEDGKWKVLNTEITFDEASLRKELDEHPERFSPNVLLRPLYQESILPNIVTIGGPAEIAYWLELLSLFRNYNVPYPVLMLRNSAMLLDDYAKSKLAKFSLQPEDIFLSEDELIRRCIIEQSFNTSATEKSISNAFDELKEQIISIDPSLAASTDAEKQKAMKGLASLGEKAARALKKKSDTDISQLKKLKQRLFPGGNLQERSETLLPFYMKAGPAFIDRLYSMFDPFPETFSIISLDEQEASIMEA